MGADRGGPTGDADTRARSPWLRPERTGRGPVPEYSRAQITEAAVRLADEGGLAAVSMRRVATAVGTAPASLYRYVATRDELLALMADAVAGELVLPERPSGDWLTDLLTLARRQLALFRRHPWMLDLGFGADRMGPHAVDVLEYGLACLARVDLPADTKLEAIAMMTGVVTLFARDELARERGQTSTEAQRATAAFLIRTVSQGRHPHLAAALAGRAGPTPTDPAVQFDRVLSGVLRGLLGAPS